MTDSPTKEECALLSFEQVDALGAAMGRAFAIQGAEAKVGVIHFGGETLVRLKDGAEI